MSGNSILIDTNIALYLLNGDETIAQLLNGKYIYLSFVSELELLGFKDISVEETNSIKQFLSDCIIIDINETIKENTIKLKTKYSTKLPDAIIAATSIFMNIPCLSSDKGFDKITELHFIRYDV